MWMTFSSSSTGAQSDTPEARRYNRIHRQLSIIDLALSFGMLVVLLTTGLTGTLRDWAWYGSRAHYWLALFFYVGLLAVISKVIALTLDVYGFRLEHRFHLSNQGWASWAWGAVRGWSLGLVLARVAPEIA